MSTCLRCYGAGQTDWLHGSSAVKVFLILLGNYIVGRSLHTTRALPAATWAFNLAILFANELNDGYRFAALHPSLAPLVRCAEGHVPRWHVTFNFTMLRLVSFNMDWYWAAHRVGLLHVRVQSHPPTFHELPAYESFMNYVSYILYPPCYIAGPIMTFNDFLWQMKRPVRIAPRDVASYALRFVICLLTMEVVLHYMYVVAIKSARAWAGDTPAQLYMLGFWNLIVVWLKLLLPWRLFRLWALSDGVEPPENMVRHGEQLFGYGILAGVALQLQPLDDAIRVHPRRRFAAPRARDNAHVHLRRAMARSIVQASPVGIAHQSFRPAGEYRQSARSFIQVWRTSVVSSPMRRGRSGQHPNDVEMVSFVLGVDGIKYLLSQLTGAVARWQFPVVVCVVRFIIVQLMLEYQ
ncbi:hypothetical protein EXIGLDRAFT_824417, partial [Exidia glandulosa HHB12029]